MIKDNLELQWKKYIPSLRKTLFTTDNAALIKRQKLSVSLHRKFRPKKGRPGLAMQTRDVPGEGDSKTILNDFKTILDSIKNLEFYSILGFFIN